MDWKFSGKNRTGLVMLHVLSIKTHTGLQMTCKKY